VTNDDATERAGSDVAVKRLDRAVQLGGGLRGGLESVRRKLALEDCRRLLGRYTRDLGGREEQAVRLRGDLSADRCLNLAEHALDLLVSNVQPPQPLASNLRIRDIRRGSHCSLFHSDGDQPRLVAASAGRGAYCHPTSAFCKNI